MTDIASRMEKLRASSVNDGGGKINPTQQMRKDLSDISEWYKTGLGWTDEQIKQLRSDYQAALQVEPFSVIADMLAAESEVCRKDMRRFFEKLESSS